MYLVQCAVSSIQWPVSSVQLEREREGGCGARWRRCHWSTPARAWLLSVSHSTQHTGYFRFHTGHSTQNIVHNGSDQLQLILTLSYTILLEHNHQCLLFMAFNLITLPHCFKQRQPQLFKNIQNLSKMWSQDNFSVPCCKMYSWPRGLLSLFSGQDVDFDPNGQSGCKMYRPLVCDQMPTTTHHQPGLLTY